MKMLLLSIRIVPIVEFVVQIKLLPIIIVNQYISIISVMINTNKHDRKFSSSNCLLITGVIISHWNRPQTEILRRDWGQ